MASASTAAASAHWDDEQHNVYVQLCAAEVIKGNRPTTTLNKEGWTNVHKEFIRQTNVKYTIRQLKNHWDAMKEDYKIFKKLKFGYSGLGWNEVTKTIDAPESWWNDRIAENKAIRKFRNKNLSLFWSHYDTLFGDIVATGERAKAANTYSAVHLEVGEEFIDIAGDDEGKEGSGDSDDNNIQTPASHNLFPLSAMKSGTSSGSKRKKSGAEFVRDGLDGLVAAMSCKSTSTTAANQDDTLNEAIDILDSMSEIDPTSDLYFFAGRYLLHKGNRTLFLKARSNASRYGQLMYNFRGAGNQTGGAGNQTGGNQSAGQ